MTLPQFHFGLFPIIFILFFTFLFLLMPQFVKVTLHWEKWMATGEGPR